MNFDKKVFQSQHRPETSLSHYMCGVACLTMVLKHFHQIKSSINYLDIFNQYLRIGKNNVPFSSIVLNVAGKNIEIPIIYYPKATRDDNKTELINDSSRLLDTLRLKHKLSDLKIHFPNPSDNFVPSFSLWYGFDHRGITPFILKNKYKIRHQLIEKDLPSILSEVKFNNAIAILSVDPSVIGTPITKQFKNNSETSFDHQDRHDIVVLKVTKYQGKEIAIIADPANSNHQNGIKLIALKTIKQAYTGHASIFSNSQFQYFHCLP